MEKGIEIVLQQVEEALDRNLYYVALVTSLALPDICAALDSSDGQTDGKRYASWFDEWVVPRFNETSRSLLREFYENTPSLGLESVVAHPMDVKVGLTGDVCYKFRCSLLHQGSSQHPLSAFGRILLVVPSPANPPFCHCQANDAYLHDLRLFCQEITAGVRLWLSSVRGTEKFARNYSKFAALHPNGLAPYVGGSPVIG